MVGSDRMGRHWLQWLVGMPSETALAVASMMLGGVFESILLSGCALPTAVTIPFILGRIDHGSACDQTWWPPKSIVAEFACGSVLGRLGVHDDDALRFLVDRIGSDQ